VPGIQKRRRVGAVGAGGVVVDQLPDGAEVGRALDGVGGPSRAGEGGEKDRNQQCDNSNNYQKFDEGERVGALTLNLHRMTPNTGTRID
jgi:hypothetical protein